MAKELIKFLIVRLVKSPFRANEFDAGIDFFVPEFNKDFIDSLIEKNEDAFSLPNLNNGAIYLSGSNCCGTVTIAGESVESVDPVQNFFGFDIKKGLPFFRLDPQKRVMIPSGVKSRMSKPGRALIAANKSGVATKTGLVFGAQVVDYTYKGEIHLSVINTSKEPVNIYQGQKIIQFLEQPVFNSEVTINKTSTSEEFFEGLQDDRGEGGFGSTDNK